VLLAMEITGCGAGAKLNSDIIKNLSLFLIVIIRQLSTSGNVS
jgi:hypothetical protein